MALCEDKKKLKEEREAARKLRKKIVGVDGKSQNMADRFNFNSNNTNTNNGGMNQINRYGSGGNNFGDMGSYDSYGSGVSLSDKIGNIMDGVGKLEDKMKEDDK